MRENSYLGLAKVKYSSSIAKMTILPNDHSLELEVFLTERLNRVKNSGEWPWRSLQKLKENYEEDSKILENRDVEKVKKYEDYLDSRFPFYDFLKKKKLEQYTSQFNSEIICTEHHLAHAKMAELFSPFSKTLIWVLDGAGSWHEDGHEYDSLYTLDSSELVLKERKTSSFYKNKAGKWVSSSIGIIYETISEYIFNNKLMAGKVMGLAPFGNILDYKNPLQMLDSLEWSLSFQGNSKDEWEGGAHKKLYQDLAATTQSFFESYVLDRVKSFEESYPDFDNLIMVGGCALNCTCNQKIIDQSKYKSLYIPPAPGDSGVSLGLAYLGLNKSGRNLSLQEKKIILSASLGPKDSVPQEVDIKRVFNKYEVKKIQSFKQICRILKDGHVIAWFQGRSEIGPRALGHRSLLADIQKKDLKNYLNREIKFREDFRPYGCSVTQEKAPYYFEVSEGFENPYMSFATRVQHSHKKLLREVTHIDGTSRMQTVRKDQNPRFYELLNEWESYTGYPILLNTSLNIMGQPILENIDQARDFLELSNVEYMVIEDYLVSKK